MLRTPVVTTELPLFLEAPPRQFAIYTNTSRPRHRHDIDRELRPLRRRVSLGRAAACGRGAASSSPASRGPSTNNIAATATQLLSIGPASTTNMAGNCKNDAKPNLSPSVDLSAAGAIVADAEKKSYVLKIDGYSRTKELLKTGERAISTRFSVGGHMWFLMYFPNGCLYGYADSVAVYLVLDSADAKDVEAKFTFSVLDKDGQPVPSFSHTHPVYKFQGKGSNWGYHAFIKQVDLEGSVHLIDDCFTIRCDVTVMKIRTEEKHKRFVMVPPGNLHSHLGDLLKSMDGADVTFHVGGESFWAHRSVLAARSSVFKAELLGSMKEKTGDPVEILDMESNVFKSLLHFIYTDSLPEQTTHEGDVHGDVVMAGHLLVAADRYNVERLKLICEEKLCNHIDSNMVATSLTLAEQHSCHGLKEACFEFLASPSNLEAMMASDGYEHLKSSCPSVLKEMIAGLLPAELKAAKDIIRTI